MSSDRQRGGRGIARRRSSGYPRSRSVRKRKNLGTRQEWHIQIRLARGALIDEKALLDGLQSGHIRHAALDVFHDEPLKPDHPLAQFENVTLTSHAAFRTLEASMTLMRRAIDIVRGIEGRHPAA